MDPKIVVKPQSEETNHFDNRQKRCPQKQPQNSSNLRKKAGHFKLRVASVPMIFVCTEIHMNLALKGEISVAGVILQVLCGKSLDFAAAVIPNRVAVFQAVAKLEHRR